MTGYRDDRETLEARLEAAQRELDEANTTIARLKGETPVDPSEDGADAQSWYTGSYKRTDVSRTLPFEITTAGYEAIAKAYRERMPHGNQATTQATQIGRRLELRGVDGTLTVEPGDKEGTTTVRVEISHASHAILQGFLTGLTTFAMAPFFKASGLPPEAFVASLVPIGAFNHWWTRKVSRYLVESSRSAILGMLETAAEIAQEHRAGAKVRVAVGEDAEQTTPVEEAVEVAAEEAHEA